jgi:hypothetical protein
MNEINQKNSQELNENEFQETNSEKINKPKKYIIINRNRGHSEFGHQLTYNKKLENELDTLPNDINKFFRKSLDKYNFHLEVYVPHSMVISKKEYYNKNYMLNNLVRTEDIIKGKKDQIANIAKETKKFSRQYELVQNKNMNHQMQYLTKLEKIYKNKGYNTTAINYKKDDNIFTPSFLLDSRYGNYLHADMVKYGQNEYKKEYKKDKQLLKKFYDYIKTNNKRGKKKGNDINDLNESSILNNNNNDDVSEDDNIRLKLLAQIKKDLDEQNRIKNMSKKEYFIHSKQIKDEINNIKDSINNYNDLNEFFKKKDKINIINKIDINIKRNENENGRYKTQNISDKNKSYSKRNGRRLFDINSNVFLSSKGMKEYSKEKNDILPDINNSKKNINNSSLKIEKTKSNNISKIPSSVKKLKFKNTDIDFKNENINQKFKTKKNINSVFISERIMKEIQKEKQLTQLYDTLNNRTSNTIFPSKQITHYFNKYSKRRMPVANTDRGSNIHGLLEDVQNIINEKNFAGFAKLNNNAKKDIMIKNKNDNNNNNKELDDEYITDLDKKILGLHYDFTENLLSDKNSQLFS